jgi:class 3 adenylate cyclase
MHQSHGRGDNAAASSLHWVAEGPWSCPSSSGSASEGDPGSGSRRVLALLSRGEGLVSSRRQATGGSDRLAGAGDAWSAGLPTGTVTFVFTDIEGSTRLLRGLGGERYGAELVRHRERVRRAVTAHDGVELGTEGDAFFIAFARASDALAAANGIQAALADGPIRVRIGIHTGEPLIVDGNYVGLDVHKAARISDAAHGGQVLVSEVTRGLAGDGLRELGESGSRI